MSDGSRRLISWPGAQLALVAPVARLRGLLALARAIAIRTGPGLAFLTLLVLWVAAYLGRALRDVTQFPGHEGDGPFQLFNPLRRIAAGQVGGVDFQYFHGIGLPYLHYPLFVLAGSDLHAAELARHVVNLAAFLVTTLAVAAALTRRLTPTLGVTVVLMLLADQFALHSIIKVENASLGLRSSVPLLLFAILLTGFRPKVESVLVGIFAGAGLLFGVEHGVAALAMIGAAWFGRRWWGLDGGSFRWAGTVAGLAVATAASGLLAIGGVTGAVGALRYAFVELPHDQFWYFGVPPNPFLYHWADVFTDRSLWLKALGPFAVVGVLATWQARSHPADRPTTVAVLGLLTYGLLATTAYFGYCSPHYLEPLTRVAIVGGVTMLWRAWVGCGAPLPSGVRWGIATVVAAFLLVGPSSSDRSSLTEVSWHTRQLAASIGTIRRGECKVVPKLQADFESLVAAIDADRATHGVTRPPVIWSTYAGRLEDHYGVFNPACDYTIHALGPVRRAAYLDAFRKSKPDYVVTYRPSRYIYEHWLRNSTWEWFEEVIQNYDVLIVGTRQVVWRLKPSGWATPPEAEARLSRNPEGSDWFTVPAPPGCAADAPRVVEVEYEVENTLAAVPIVGKLPRYLLGPSHCQNSTPVSLPPGRTTWSFAVVPQSDQVPAFYGKTFSLVGGGLKIRRVHIRPLKANQEQISAMMW